VEKMKRKLEMDKTKWKKRKEARDRLQGGCAKARKSTINMQQFGRCSPYVAPELALKCLNMNITLPIPTKKDKAREAATNLHGPALNA